jgi:hypothetical protein
MASAAIRGSSMSEPIADAVKHPREYLSAFGVLSGGFGLAQQ